MNYKELYENALGRAKAACGTGAYDDATIEFLFPEIDKQSDIEIKDELLEYLRNIADGGYQNVTTAQANKWIDWLEQQKDRMAPIYDSQDSFEAALDKAWNHYNGGQRHIDELENDPVELAFAKGFREGFLYNDFCSIRVLPSAKRQIFPKDAVFAIMRKLHDLYLTLPMGSKEERLTDEITSDVRHLLDYNTSSKTDLVEEPYSKKKPSMRFTLHMYEDNPNNLYLSHFPIDEMSKIIAKTAMDAIESAAKALGVNQIFVRVKNDANVTSRYYNLGFEYCNTEGEYKWLYK